jgi:hypothetical protein
LRWPAAAAGKALRNVRSCNPMTDPHFHPVDVDTRPLVERVRRGDTAGEEGLYRLLNRGIRFLAVRKLPASQVDSCVDRVFARMVDGIQCGDLSDPGKLVQYAHRHLTACVREMLSEAGPALKDDEPGATRRHRQAMRNLLGELSPVERTSMVHFYLEGRDDGRICRDLRMPRAEFDSLRVRLKARFRELLPAGR